MSEKRKSTSTSTIQVKNQQKKISIEEKLDLIRRLEKGELIVDIWLKFRFAHSRVHSTSVFADRTAESTK
jgi:hypothetical protein